MKKNILFFLFLFGLFNIVHSANYETSIRWDATSATGGSAIGRFSSNQYFSSAQSFNITENANLNNISVRVGTFAGTSRNYYLEIVTGDVNNNTVLCSSDNTLISSTGDFNFVFSSACSLNQGQTYWYRFIRVGTFNSGDYAFLYNTGGTDYYGTTFFNTRSEQTTDSYLWNQPNTALDISSKLFYSTSDLAININDPLNNEYLDNTSFLVNVTTTEITDLYYILNGGFQTSLCSSCNATTNTLIGVEGLNNLTIISNQSGSVTNESISFTIDTTQPIITNNLPSEINSYTLNFNSTTCSDINLDTCFLSIQGSTYDLLTLSNASLTYNGNWSYNITATDLAGTQVQESGNVLINPVGYLYFLNQTGDYISEVYLNGYLVSNPYTFYYYNDNYSIGLNTILFESEGYANEEFNFTLATTGILNQSFVSYSAKIVVNIYDRETGNLITDNVDLTLIATTGYQTNTSTGQVNISDLNFIEEQYQLIADSLNYATETVYFNFNNQEILDVNIYMLDLNATDYGFINIVAVADTGQFVNNAVCKAMEWIPISSSFLTRSEGLTNTQGQTSLNIEIGTKSYKFRCTKDGYTTDSNAQIISSSGQTVTLVLSIGSITPEPQFENVDFSLYNVTYNSTHQRIYFDWMDNDGTSRGVCLKQYRLGAINKLLLNQSCSTSSSGQIQLLSNVNQTYNILFEAYIDDSKMDTLTFLGSESFAFNLKNYHLDIFLPLIFIILGISAGFFIQPQNIYISILMVMVGTALSFFIVPTIISFSIATFIWIICGFLLWGGSRQ
jgi:hypothetical protein